MGVSTLFNDARSTSEPVVLPAVCVVAFEDGLGFAFWVRCRL